MKREVIVVLDNIRSAHNAGSVFRTADGAGVKKIYLAGTTPTPIDRFGREVAEIKKTSLGASRMVEWEHVINDNVPVLIERLKEDGFMIVVIEQAPGSVSLYDFKTPDKVCYVFGNEVEGVGHEWLQSADQVVEIPMKGKKESLNVSVTVGIVLFKNG